MAKLRHLRMCTIHIDDPDQRLQVDRQDVSAYQKSDISRDFPNTYLDNTTTAHAVPRALRRT